MQDNHYRKLERMYLSAPINAIYKPQITIEEKRCEVRMEVKSEFCHAAHTLHGAVYFKMLDDSAFFAANSVVLDTFILTTHFDIHFLRPVEKGTLLAVGTLVSGSTNLFISESKLFDDTNQLVAIGMGFFMKSRKILSPEIGYK